MPFNGSGSFSIVNTFVSNTTILSAAVNQNYTDIATGLSDCLTRDGQAGMTANLAMGAHSITGVADPVNPQDAVTLNYLNTNTWGTGDIKVTLKTVADTGWVMMNDGTIGNTTSGGTTLANTATAAALFTLIWNNIINTWCPIQDSTGTPTTRGVSAAADFAASKRMPLPKALGRALAMSGAGSGLTSRALGQTLGEESHTLLQAELPSVTLTTNVSDPGHFHNLPGSVPNVSLGGASASASGATIAILSTTQSAVTGITASTPLGGSGTPFNQMQPSSFLNLMIKL